MSLKRAMYASFHTENPHGYIQFMRFSQKDYFIIIIILTQYNLFVSRKTEMCYSLNHSMSSSGKNKCAAGLKVSSSKTVPWIPENLDIHIL